MIRDKILGFEEKFKKMEIPVDGQHVIYRLTDGGEVVYVGKSMNVRNRIYQHIIESKKEFDGFDWKYTTEHDCFNDEADEILRSNPKYNVTLPACSKYLSKGSALKFIRDRSECLIDAISPVYESVTANGLDHIKYSVRDLEYITEKVNNAVMEEMRGDKENRVKKI